MKDEIKEILQKFNEEVGKVELVRNPFSSKDKKFKKILIYLEEEHCDIFKNVLDYITNLQNENKKYDLCLTELTDNYKDLQKELTNLQEENKHIFANVNDDQLLRSNAMNYAEAQDYKTRNEKASTYIEHYLIGNIAKAENCQRSLKYLLNILQGKSNE